MNLLEKKTEEFKNTYNAQNFHVYVDFMMDLLKNGSPVPEGAIDVKKITEIILGDFRKESKQLNKEFQNIFWDSQAENSQERHQWISNKLIPVWDKHVARVEKTGVIASLPNAYMTDPELNFDMFVDVLINIYFLTQMVDINEEQRQYLVYYWLIGMVASAFVANSKGIRYGHDGFFEDFQ